MEQTEIRDFSKTSERERVILNFRKPVNVVFTASEINSEINPDKIRL